MYCAFFEAGDVLEEYASLLVLLPCECISWSMVH